MKPLAPYLVAVALSSLMPLTVVAEERAPATTTPSPDAFVCTQVMGVSVTGDWFGAGFEDGIDGGRWQALWRSHAFVDLWADPASDLWAMKPQSPCAQRSDNPDRVIFTGVNWEYKTREAWQEKLAAVVETIRTKYPGVRRIDLLTMLRGPDNRTCGSEMTVVAALRRRSRRGRGFAVSGPGLRRTPGRGPKLRRLHQGRSALHRLRHVGGRAALPGRASSALSRGNLHPALGRALCSRRSTRSVLEPQRRGPDDRPGRARPGPLRGGSATSVAAPRRQLGRRAIPGHHPSAAPAPVREPARPHPRLRRLRVAARPRVGRRLDHPRHRVGSALLGFAQEHRASTAVAQLRQRLALTVQALRDGAVPRPWPPATSCPAT